MTDKSDDNVIRPSLFQRVKARIKQVTGQPYEPTFQIDEQTLIHCLRQSTVFRSFQALAPESRWIEWQWVYEPNGRVAGIKCRIHAGPSAEPPETP